MYRRIVVFLMLIFIISIISGCSWKGQVKEGEQNPPSPVVPSPDNLPVEEKDPIKEQIKNMTMDDKLSQMLIVGIEGYAMDEDTRSLIEENRIGGFILYGSNIESPNQLINLVNSLKSANSLNSIPLFISVDEEGGRISRMPEELQKLPKAKEIGKINSTDLAYQIGSLLAKEVKAFGFNLNYAPVLDVNSNPKNPVIGDRAFGSKPDLVSRLGIETMRGLQDGGVIPVVKHFPGHGDTSVDSHVGLPSVEYDMDRLNSFELIPFKAAIENGADVVMVAHILLPKIDAVNPATLSKTIISDILREQLDFNGVAITDDITMGAISKNYELGAAAVKAIEAGNDIVLVAHGYDNATTALNALKDAVNKGLLSEERINESVYRIIKLKQEYGLQDSKIDTPDIEELNSKIDSVLSRYFK